MGNKVLSVEIGQQIIRVCEVDYRKKNPHVYQSISFETPAGVVEDGFIRDKLALATILREQLNVADMKTEKVVFTLSSTKIASREALIPLVKDNQVNDIIKTNAKDYFPVNIEEYDLTYCVLEKTNTKELKQMRILVLAAPSLLVKTYFELADMMNLHIVSIDYSGNSSYQLLRGQVGMGVNLVVQINDHSSVINLLENESLLLQRTIPYGTTSIASSVISNSVFEVSNYSDAIGLLNKEKLIKPHFDNDDEVAFTLEDVSEEYTQQSIIESAKSDVTNSLTTLLSNISRVIDYFVTRHPGKKIDNFYITGEGTKIQGIEELIMNELGFEVKSLCRFINITFGKTSAELESNTSVFLSCIGAAINPIDFTPTEYSVKPIANSTMLFPVLLLVVSVLGALGIFISSLMVYNNSKDEYNSIDTKIKEIQDIQTLYSDYQVSESDLKNIEAFDALTKSAGDDFLTFIKELEDKTPVGTLVQTISIQEKSASIQATSTSKEVLAKYVEELQTIESLLTVFVSNFVETKDDNGMPTVSYTVVCVFK